MHAACQLANRLRCWLQVLSRVFLRVKYTRRHLLAASVCVVGLALLVASDAIGHRFDGESSTVGDMCTYLLSVCGLNSELYCVVDHCRR